MQGTVARINREYGTVTTKNFQVKNGLTTGNINLYAGNGTIAADAVSSTGNISALYLLGNGSQLTAVVASEVGILPSLSVTGNITAGNVSAANISGTLTTASQPNITAVGTLSSLTVGELSSTGEVMVNGNVTADGFLTGGLISAAGNITGNNLSATNIAGTLTTASQTNITSVGTLTSLNSGAISSSGNITGTNILTGGLISASSNIIAGNISVTNITGTLTTASQTNITSVGTLTSLNSGAISSSGNITAGYFIGDGSQLTGLPAGYANSDVANYLASGTDTQAIITSGNITGGNILTTGLVSTGGNVVSNSWVTGGNISTGGNVLVNGYVSVVGNLYVANIVSTSNLVVQDPLVYLTANSTYPYNYDIGFYSQFTGDPGNTYQHTGLVRDYTDNTWKIFSNVVPEPTSGAVDLTNAIYDPLKMGALTATSGSFSSTISATANITAGNVLTDGLVSASGNITGNNLSATNIAGTLTTASQTNITSVGTLTSLNSGAISSSGNITGANILTGGLISAAANITVGNILTGGLVSAASNITGGNILTSGLVSVEGNVTANTVTSTRVNPRVSSTTSTASVTPDIGLYDQYNFTAQAVTLAINAPIGSPADGNKLIFRILDNGTSQTLNWNGTYTVIGVTLPTTTTINKTTYVGCLYNAAATRWDVIAVATQA